jgi:hypothetical protein
MELERLGSGMCLKNIVASQVHLSFDELEVF